jgi:Novel STAND NTPase 3
MGWYNFELLAQTLLKAVIGPGVTSFGGTKDRGRDATFKGAASFPSVETRWQGRWVFQVKYVDSESLGAADARRALKGAFDIEMTSILARRRAPDNYVLITNVPLTGDSRDRLHDRAEACGFKGEFAVIDGKEVCQFLDIYPNIRRSYPQLLGLVDLDRIVHRGLYTRSKAYVELWQPRLATYVLVEAHKEAIDVLNRRRFAVLDGPPEVGKTTIAAALALIHAAEGFEVLDVRRSEDFFSGYNPEQAQFFVADDAIGSVSFDPGLADNWARDLPGIVAKLDSKHMLIWTARRYILEEAVTESKLAESVSQFPGPHEVVVEVGKLTPLEKAEILYNHAKGSELGQEPREFIRRNAVNIVYHQGFTPERVRQLVEVILAPRGTVATSSAPLTWAELNSFLSNPGDRWTKAYRAISSSERDLLVSMLDFDFRARIQELEGAYTARASAGAGSRLPFEQCLDRLQHSFLGVSKDDHGHRYVNFQHPSLRDLLLSEVNQTSAVRKRYIELASPSGLAGVIRGLAAADTGSKSEHAVVPRSNEELSALFARLAGLAKRPLSFEDWVGILAATDLGVPRTPRDATGVSDGSSARQILEAVLQRRRQKLPPSELDLNQFGASVAGRIIREVLAAFGSATVYENNRRYNLGDWSQLFRRYYELSVYIVPPPRPEFTRHLLSGLDGKDTSAEIGLSNIVARFEPVLVNQLVGARQRGLWHDYLKHSLEELVDAGESLESSEWFAESDYEEWKSKGDQVYETAEAFYEWSEKSEPEFLKRLGELLENVSPPPEPDYQGREEEVVRESDFWSIPRIFEDL